MRLIETEHLRLRRWRHEDFPEFARFWQSPAATAFVGGPISRQDAWNCMLGFIGHWELRGFGYFVIEHRETGRMAGYCGGQLPLDKQELELGWGIFDEFQGIGHATEAVLAGLRFLGEQCGWTTAISRIADNNVASIAVARKLGGVREGFAEINGLIYGTYRHPIAMATSKLDAIVRPDNLT